MSVTLAKNTILKLSDMAMSPAFTQISGVESIKGPNPKWQTTKTTNNDNSTPVETMQPTIYSLGDCVITFPYNSGDTQHVQLRAASRSGAILDFKKLTVDGETQAFSAFVTGWDAAEPVDNLERITATISVTGAMTIS